ncbi:hypothetical protein VNO77_22264 [Canavalia gladiata]|uniref:Uncharacterized protein n=1 Tax=Canavalia gladiata TaxID=3824 RepID=A0AAN9L2G2_CANGL
MLMNILVHLNGFVGMCLCSKFYYLSKHGQQQKDRKTKVEWNRWVGCPRGWDEVGDQVPIGPKSIHDSLRFHLQISLSYLAFYETPLDFLPLTHKITPSGAFAK